MKTLLEIKLIYFYKNVEILFHKRYTLFIEMNTDTSREGETDVWFFDLYE